MQPTTHKDSLQSPTNANLVTRQHSSEEPMFLIVGSEEAGFIVTFGKYQILEAKETIEECEDAIRKKAYQLIFGLMGVAIEESKNKIEELQTDINSR